MGMGGTKYLGTFCHRQKNVPVNIARFEIILFAEKFQISFIVKKIGNDILRLKKINIRWTQKWTFTDFCWTVVRNIVARLKFIYENKYDSHSMSHQAWVLQYHLYDMIYWKEKVDQKFILSEAIKFAMEILRLLVISWRSQLFVTFRWNHDHTFPKRSISYRQKASLVSKW